MGVNYDKHNSGKWSIIQVDGMTIEYNNGVLKVNGNQVDIKGVAKEQQRNKEYKGNEIKDSKTINGDVTGDLKITGDNVKLVINGDVTGNIVGKCEIQVKGDLTGNIVGGKIK